MIRLRLITSALLSALFLAGCASHNARAPLHVAFEDITSEVTSRSGPDLSYNSAVSVTGLGRVLRVANQIFYPGGGLADTYSIGIAPKFSRLDVVRFPMEKNPPPAYQIGGDNDPSCPMPAPGDNKKFAKLLEVRNLYVCARDRLVDQAALELKLQLAQLGLVGIKENRPDARKSVSALLFGAKNGDANDQTIAQAVLELQGALANKRRDANKAATALRMAVNTPNLLVTRWTTERTSSQGLSVGAIAGIDRQSRIQTSGVLILGDLRVASIRFGEDFLASLVESDLSNFERGLGVVTTTIQSRYQLEIQDVDFGEAIRAQMALSPEDLMLLGTDPTRLLKRQDIKISMALAELASVGNASALTDAKPEEYAFSFFPWDVYEDALKQECRRSHGFTTVYSVRAIGSELVERVLREAGLAGDRMASIRVKQNNGKMPDPIDDFLKHIDAHTNAVRSGSNECADSNKKPVA